MKCIKLAIIGTGGMASAHAGQYNSIKGCRVVAACDLDANRVKAFAEKYGIPHTFTSATDLLNHADIDAVSIVTPDAAHLPVALPCLAAGKHVLCEKPLAVNYPDARRMATAARKADVVNMVNFSYRDWSALQAVAIAVGRGDIGELRHVEASYLQAWLPSKIWGDWRTRPGWLWRLSTQHGSQGVLGDIGVHIVDFVTFPAGPLREVNCQLKTFPKVPGNRIGPYKLDANDSAVMTVEFANGALGVIHTSRWVGGHANRLFLRLSGTEGTIEIDSDKSREAYRVCCGAGLDTCTWRDVKAKPVRNNYQKFIRAIQSGTPGDPDFARGAEVQKVLDACFASDHQRCLVKISRSS